MCRIVVTKMSEEIIRQNYCSVTNVQKFISKYPDFEYNGSRVRCLVCNKDLLLWKRSHCEKHVKSANHMWKKRGLKPYAEFIMDLIFMMSVCNIPFHNIQKEQFRKFCDKYNPDWKLPSESTLRNYLPRVRERIEAVIRREFRGEKLWLTVDESMDSKKNLVVVHIIVQILKPSGSSLPYLIATTRLPSRTGETIKNVIVDTLQKFEISATQVLMFVTDNRLAMLHAGRLLKPVFPNLLHVMCILHMLNLVAETICDYYPDVKELIAQTRAVFANAPKRIRQFHEQCPNIPEPPGPDLTQWGTWLEAAFYYFQHFPLLRSLLLQLDTIEAAAIKESQLKFQDHQVEIDLQTIFNNYQVITNAIAALQRSSLSLGESLQIIDSVQRGLESLSDEKSVCVKATFNGLLQKNTDLARLRRIYNNSAPADEFSCFKDHYNYANITSLHMADLARLRRIYNNSAPADEFCCFKDHYNYANITSLHMEQSFSLYKNIFSPLRTRLKDTTAETYAMIWMFSRTRSES
ncbi:hypothetical protein AMK59_6429 [Oryctes borbonicus]|uniref:DUF659 domain-containing protein n=1 Tax=Oryctes borbonicus TaxID=1629725 RepID=A0A0T6AY45_9SCAR|nr:hypothetical protein AMK59_6429 [Oryctes borbonicus]